MFGILRRLMVAGVAAVGVLAGAGSVSAQSISNDTAGTLTNIETVGTVDRIGQVIEVPAGATRLKSFTYWIEPGPSGLKVQPMVRGYDATTDRYATQVIEAGVSQVLTGGKQAFTFTFDAPVEAGKSYLLSLDLTDGNFNAEGDGSIELVQTDVFSTGFWLEVHFNSPAPYANKDARFKAVFGTDVVAVPTMGEWSLILLALALAAGAAFVMIRRRAVI